MPAKKDRPPQLNVPVSLKSRDEFNSLSDKYAGEGGRTKFMEALIEYLKWLDKNQPEQLKTLVNETGPRPLDRLYATLEHWVWTDHSIRAETGWALENLNDFPDPDSPPISKLVTYRTGLAWLEMAAAIHAEAFERAVSGDADEAGRLYEWAVQCAGVTHLRKTQFLETAEAARAPVGLFNRACSTSLIVQLEIERRWVADPARAAEVRAAESHLPAVGSGPVRNPTAELWTKGALATTWGTVAGVPAAWVRQRAEHAFADLNAVFTPEPGSELPNFVNFIGRKAARDPDLTFLRSAAPYSDRFSTWLGNNAKKTRDVCQSLFELLVTKAPDKESLKQLLGGRKPAPDQAPPTDTK